MRNHLAAIAGVLAVGFGVSAHAQTTTVYNLVECLPTGQCARVITRYMTRSECAYWADIYRRAPNTRANSWRCYSAQIPAWTPAY